MSKSGITMYFHCRECVENLPDGISPMDYQSLEVGTNDDGFLVVWCKRHDILVGSFKPERDVRNISCLKCEGEA